MYSSRQDIPIHWMSTHHLWLPLSHERSTDSGDTQYDPSVAMLWAVMEFEGDVLPASETAVSGAGNAAVVHKHDVTAAVRHDEAPTFLAVDFRTTPMRELLIRRGRRPAVAWLSRALSLASKSVVSSVLRWAVASCPIAAAVRTSNGKRASAASVALGKPRRPAAVSRFSAAIFG